MKSLKFLLEDCLDDCPEQIIDIIDRNMSQCKGKYNIDFEEDIITEMFRSNGAIRQIYGIERFVDDVCCPEYYYQLFSIYRLLHYNNVDGFGYDEEEPSSKQNYNDTEQDIISDIKMFYQKFKYIPDVRIMYYGLKHRVEELNKKPSLLPRWEYLDLLDHFCKMKLISQFDNKDVYVDDMGDVPTFNIYMNAANETHHELITFRAVIVNRPTLESQEYTYCVMKNYEPYQNGNKMYDIGKISNDFSKTFIKTSCMDLINYRIEYKISNGIEQSNIVLTNDCIKYTDRADTIIMTGNFESLSKILSDDFYILYEFGNDKMVSKLIRELSSGITNEKKPREKTKTLKK